MAYDLLIKNGSVIDGTGEPARHADIAIFDPQTVGSTIRGEWRFDIPGRGRRVAMRCKGVEYAIVNGEISHADGQVTEATTKRSLRS